MTEFESPDAFALDDPRRLTSERMDLGYHWSDGARRYPCWALRYLRETGDVYAEELSGRRQRRVRLLGRVPADDVPERERRYRRWYDTLDNSVLAGWADEPHRPLSWVTERLGSGLPADLIKVISFGYGHSPAPEAHLIFDVRGPFRDPHLSPDLQALDASSPAVVQAVITTPGVLQLAQAVTDAVAAFRLGPSGGAITVAIGCAGGRHRAPVIAAEVFKRLNGPAIIQHRDLHQPVIERPGRR